MKIGLLGSSLDTGNLGVSALAESAIKCILHRWPDAKVTLLDSGRLLGEHRQRIGDKDVCVRELPIRFCKNVFLGNHFLVLCLYALLFRVFRWEKFKRFCGRRNSSLRNIIQMDLVADITGGDSFSDIYGMRRFVLGFLRKWLVLLFKKDLVMLPQTYGPFKRRLARAMARHILKKARLVYSRDKAGIGYVNALLNNRQNGKVRFIPDVAFVLDSREPEHLDIEPSANIRVQNSIVVGLNISGLLYNGGYTRDNMFGLKTDYPELVYRIIDSVLADKKSVVLLVPHVFHPPGHVESDSEACSKVYEAVSSKYRDRIFRVSGSYNQNEIKYVIGKCDFFIGSRMHSCIAALSQGTPTVGLAYSRKFQGVFSSIGADKVVIDMRKKDQEEIVHAIAEAFTNRAIMAKHLRVVIPKIQNKVLSMLQNAE